MKVLNAIRKAPMLNGTELPVRNGKVILPPEETNFNNVQFVNVLKENCGKPVWWFDTGINWIWFYATTLENAVELYEDVTGTRKMNSDEISEWRGAYAFRLHI